mmetsp:Transcript_88019/g.252231  ORF Transcript_88019/g.252231 Transcript_88019/m.252231 type:complete len:581 (+) Transcript_88019:92-1834(+)
MRVIIVGGVAGGASTAARLRRLSEEAEIMIFEKGGYVSFANCGLPYYLGGEIHQWNALQIVSPEVLLKRFNLDVNIHKEVVSIDRAAKSVTVKDVLTGETADHSYDHLVLSVGCEAIVPQAIPGIARDGHFTLKSMEDTAAIERHIAAVHPKRVVICGGGFIGLEIAEQLAHRSFQVSIVEAMDQVLAPLDPEMAEQIHKLLRTKGIQLHLNDAVASFDEPPTGASVSDVVLKSGARLPADLVIVSLGVRPSTAFAAEAGLELTSRGHVKVDDRMRTVTDPCIWAVGDAIQVRNSAMGGDETWAVALGGPANRQGRICAENIAGHPQAGTYRGTLGANGVQLFGLTAASVGVNEKFLRSKQVAYKAVYLHPKQHAEFFPGVKLMHMKLLFDPSTGKIFGAQAVGEDGVEKRIDVISGAMHAGLPARELADLELCYAPPFNGARDPVNMAGMIAGNIMDGLLDTITPLEFIESVRSGEFERSSSTLLDVRFPANFAKEGPISMVPEDHRIHVALEGLREALSPGGELSDRLRKGCVVVACNSGQRAHTASRLLMQTGYSGVKVMSGSFLTYSLFESMMQKK